MSLLDDLQSAGLTVVAVAGWDTNTNSGRDRVETVGVVNHWDAIKAWPGAAYYLSGNRLGGILYHIVIQADGTVNLLSQRYVWHAGRGSSQILNVAQNGGPVPDDTPGRDDTNGNPHFFGVCINYHPDNGPVPAVQYDALVTTNRVLCDHFGLADGQVFRHMDWTARKRDIDTINLDTFRHDLGAGMAAPNLDEVSGWAEDAWNWAYENSLLSETSHPQDTISKEELMVFLKRYDGGN